MIVICITVCIVTALICASICFIYREKTYSATDLSEQQLLEDIAIRANSVFDRFLDNFNVPSTEENKGYKDLFNAIEDIVKMTSDYFKINDD